MMEDNALGRVQMTSRPAVPSYTGPGVSPSWPPKVAPSAPQGAVDMDDPWSESPPVGEFAKAMEEGDDIAQGREPLAGIKAMAGRAFEEAADEQVAAELPHPLVQLMAAFSAGMQAAEERHASKEALREQGEAAIHDNLRERYVDRPSADEQKVDLREQMEAEGREVVGEVVIAIPAEATHLLAVKITKARIEAALRDAELPPHLHPKVAKITKVDFDAVPVGVELELSSGQAGFVIIDVPVDVQVLP